MRKKRACAICYLAMMNVGAASMRAADADWPSTGAPGVIQESPSPAQPPVKTGISALDDTWDGYQNAKDRLRNATGTGISLNWDIVYHYMFTGPAQHASRGVERYDLNINQRLWQGAVVDFTLRGGWGKGVDPVVPNFANTDQFEGVGTGAFVLHLYFAQKLFDNQLTLRIGKFDIGDWLDTNRYGYYNFIGYSFAHNSTIPLPGNTLGAMFTYEPNWAKWFYIQGGVSNAIQNPRESGLNNSFDSSAQYFAMGEAGIRTKISGMDGIYRFIGWYDPRTLTREDTGTTEKNRAGFALSFDQDITRQLGLFFRYGFADQNVFEPRQYISYGFNIKEPIPGRTKDDLSIGVVHNLFAPGWEASNSARNADYETYIEAYYQAWLTPWMFLQPAVQIVTDPGGMSRSTEVVGVVHLGLRF